MALALGKSAAWVRRYVSARELAEWRVVDRLHPIGDVRADLRAGLAADAVRAAFGAKPAGAAKYVIEGKPRARRPRKRGGGRPVHLAGRIAQALGLRTVPNGG